MRTGWWVGCSSGGPLGCPGQDAGLGCGGTAGPAAEHGGQGCTFHVLEQLGANKLGKINWFMSRLLGV